MNQVRTAMIIGAGVAGPVTAIALKKAGIDSVVYEAHSQGAEGIGSFLTLATNGFSALASLSAADNVAQLGFESPHMTMLNHRGKVLGQTSQSTNTPGGTVSRTLRRSDLYSALLETAHAAGIRFETGKRLVNAHEDSDKVVAEFADRTTAEADILIGCDGIHSTVRRIIDPNAPQPRYVGLINTGGFAPKGSLNLPAGTYQMMFGKRAFFGYGADHDDQVWWFANLPHPTEPARGELTGQAPEALRRQLIDLFADDHSPAVELIKATPELPLATPIHSIPHLPNWHRGRMVVIGDAAHAPSPSSGQGASLSIEDAVELARCLRDLSEPEAAFTRFTDIRRPRVEAIIQWAARINNSKAAGPVARIIRDAVLPIILKKTADSKIHRDMHNHQIDWDATVRAA
ncbi:2-polyprenyl-6-methoxyphenol hydroxylase-like FAD-dependent oxidoreductase [Stackebrandtia endophytica]|uniref:2-polyprenyl-6-methoxyphenol hydroxylase-like FAD-dependent oxidoreductase n=1 Tax=Stackebrandtia endophytica TaxID=1496996 RepID=A0A543AR87_9ACTN|nr:NAD(P)/FAD-dependent oxidoreductase [Stackebrandtia endophytica]TQL75101.1 2-polyprenyl-6-methoxyphenol hydroxylase-like FAD-dependent oxidoreductase [Stackebrandtia endophytica]